MTTQNLTPTPSKRSSTPESAWITTISNPMAFCDGVLVFHQAGALPAAGLEHLIAGVGVLDLDARRAGPTAGQRRHRLDQPTGAH